ncbi:hypothetical protein AHAS_Ahas19G0178500 [Arachis hypogaea]
MGFVDLNAMVAWPQTVHQSELRIKSYDQWKIDVNRNKDDSVKEHAGRDRAELPYLSNERSREASNLHDLLDDGAQELYPGCSKFPKLSFLVSLYHIKSMCGVSNKAFEMILELLVHAFEHARIPSTMHHAKRIIRKLGITYKMIDACPNDCMLYQGSDQELSKCKRCATSGWKQKTNKNSRVRINRVVKKNRKLQAAKTLRYFPLIPRFDNLSGWNTYGGRTCLACNLDAETNRLTHSQMIEDRGPPVKLSGGDITRQLQDVHVHLGKVQSVTGKRTRLQQTAIQDESRWKKRSIFFKLPYWENNRLRYNLDVMHIEKNVCDNIVFTILKGKGKSKDHFKARKDLQLMGIKHALWPRDDGKTWSIEEGFKTQNSGVHVTSDTRSYASKHDSNVAVGSFSYYGQLVDIIELNYSGQFIVVLFRCIWANTTSGRGIKQDILGHNLVNFSNPIHTDDREDDEPYIIALEACLVYFVEDDVDKNWSVVVHVKPRDLFDMGEKNEHCELELYPQPSLTWLAECDMEGFSLIRKVYNDPFSMYAHSQQIFSKAIVQASPFSSLEHATLFARDLWFNKSPIQSWLNVFSAHLYIDEAAKFAPGPIMLELEQFGRKYRRKFGFVFITSTDKKLSHQILQEVKTRYENPLSVELDITSREEFILIERKLAQLWEHLSRENTRETPKETGEVVQDSMQKENVMKDDSSKRLFLL